MAWENPNPARCVSDPTGIFEGEVASRGDLALWLECKGVPLGSEWRIGKCKPLWQVVDGEGGTLSLCCDTDELTPDGLRNFRQHRGKEFRTSIIGHKCRVLVAIHRYTKNNPDCPLITDIAQQCGIHPNSARYQVARMVPDGLVVHRQRAQRDIHLTVAGARIAQGLL